jgi:hypothetical protein
MINAMMARTGNQSVALQERGFVSVGQYRARAGKLLVTDRFDAFIGRRCHFIGHIDFETSLRVTYILLSRSALVDVRRLLLRNRLTSSSLPEIT